jgi:glycosyltransferase involved in cell wall biosynthesis
VKIGIDCRLSGSRHAGIGRYIANLVKNLPKLLETHQLVLFFYDQEQASEIFENKPKNTEFIFVPIRHYSIAEQIKLPLIFLEHNLNLLHIPHFNIPIFYPKKMVITIHDLLWHQQKGPAMTTLNGPIYWLKYLGYKLVTNLAIKKASKIFVPAQTIKKTVTTYYPNSKNKIIITKEGIEKHFFCQNNNKNNTNKTIVYTGSLYPHKNIKVVLEALKYLPGYQLKIVGSRNIFVDRTKKIIKKLKLINQVEFLGYLEDKELIKLYQTTFVLVQPSLSEGFGLTGIEAMAASLPVIASDIPILKEIYQDAAIYFDPFSPKDFARALKDLENTNKNQLIKKGQVIAKQYNWQLMAKKTSQIYLN